MTNPKLMRCGSLSLVVCTVLCWSYQSTLVKLTKTFDAAWMLWVIVLVSLVIYSVLLLIHGHSPLGPRGTPAKVRLLLFLEPLFEVLGYGFLFYAMQNAPLGDAVTLWDMDVIWTAVLFAIWERKCPSRYHLFSILLAFGGIILVCQPEIIFKGAHDEAYKEFSHLTLGYITAFSAALCFTFMFVFVAKLQEAGIHWTVIEFNFVPVGLAILPFFTWAVNDWKPPPHIPTQDWISALVVAILDTIARICATFALQVESPPLVALIATLEIPTTYFFSFVLTGEKPNYLSAIGAGLIFIAIIIMGVRDLLDDRDPGGESEVYLQPKDESDPLLNSASNSVDKSGRRSSVLGRRGLASPLLASRESRN